MLAKDPVCTMTVETSKAAATREYKGTTYYFCSRICAEEFAKNQEQYLPAEKDDAHCGHHGGQHQDGY